MLLQPERTKIILQYLEEHHSATVKQMARDVFMSQTTVRRELAKLEKQGIIRRGYGFAELLKYQNNTLPFMLRINDNRKNKSIIAKKAVKLIKDGQTIFLDESSTTCLVAELIDADMDLTVITTSLIIASIMAQKRIKTYCPGGQVNFDTLSFYGKFAHNLTSSMYADKFFFSSSGITKDGVICDKVEENANINSLMLQHSKQKIYLCDHSKFDTTYTHIITTSANIDILVTDDTHTSPEFLQLFKAYI